MSVNIVGNEKTILKTDKVEVTKQQVNIPNERLDYAKNLIKEAAKIIAGDGIQYTGSFCVYMFERQSDILTNRKNFFIVTQTDLEKIDEGLCDQALKQARIDLMASYGRRKERTTK